MKRLKKPAIGIGTALVVLTGAANLTGASGAARLATTVPPAAPIPDDAAPPSAPADPSIPSWTPIECGTYSGKGCSPADKRVDLTKPTFNDPTRITNPLFPISSLRSAVLLGQVDDKPFRSETVVLPHTDTIMWDGTSIELVISQYTAYSAGHIEEIAIDRYAQADDGSVWYFGEDVFDYRDGGIFLTAGSWLAGRDGPPAMIMPAKPKVGDVFRSESVIGVVFEELEVLKVEQTVPGPRGPISGAVVMSELHLDGTHSDKTFAPGYGEFDTSSGGNTESLALAAPIDALDGGRPTVLQRLSTSAWGLLEDARQEDWEAGEPTLDRINALWKAISATPQPPRVTAAMTAALKAANSAVDEQDPAAAAQASVLVAQAALDLELRYQPTEQIDVDRFHLHAQQLRVHAAANSAAGVLDEVAVLEWTSQRLGDRFHQADGRLDEQLRDLRRSAEAGNLTSAADLAARMAAGLRSRAAA